MILKLLKCFFSCLFKTAFFLCINKGRVDFLPLFTLPRIYQACFMEWGYVWYSTRAQYIDYFTGALFCFCGHLGFYKFSKNGWRFPWIVKSFSISEKFWVKLKNKWGSYLERPSRPYTAMNRVGERCRRLWSGKSFSLFPGWGGIIRVWSRAG